MKLWTERIIAWSLLLGSAFASIVLAAFLSNSKIGETLMLFTGELGPMGNWAFSLLAVSIGGCVFLLRGIGNSGWSVSLLGVVAVIGPAIIMFLFGIHGLIAVVLMSLILALRVISRRES